MQESPEEMRAEMAELAAMYETINIEQVIASWGMGGPMFVQLEGGRER